jgi:hypothetical protein
MSILNTVTEDLEYLLARVELEGETCGLKHSKHDPAEDHEAVDYLVQNLGDQKTGMVTQQIRIPVCQECVDALSDNNWILVYCIHCHKSQWISRRLAKKEYPEGNLIYWTDVCPFCAEIADEYKED